MATITSSNISGKVRIVTVDTNPAAGAGTNLPVGTFAQCEAGGFFEKVGISDTDWAKIGGIPTVRYVYLVGDAADATRIGGTTNNVYTTCQAAYDAANALQIALGGINKVVIMVGNTASSVTLGTFTLAANWNVNVSIVGLSPTTSFIGAFIGTTFTIDVKLSNVTVNAASSSSAGITMSTENCVINALSTVSTTGNSGNILLSNCFDTTFGTLTLDSAVGNSGTANLLVCIGCTIGSVFMRATAAAGDFSVGSLVLANCRSVSFNGQITLSITNASSLGTIGGIAVGRTNGFIFFNQPVNILGCTTAVRSDVQINLVQLYNCVFNNTVLINTTGTFISERGGWVLTTDINNCIFYHRFRLVHWPINPHAAGMIVLPDDTEITLSIKNTKFTSLSQATSFGMYIQNNDISYTTFELEEVYTNDLSAGVSIGTNVTEPTTTSFMIDGGIIALNSVNSRFIGISTNDPTVSSGYFNCILTKCIAEIAYLEVYDGDFKYGFNSCDFTTFATGADFGGLYPLTKSFEFNNSRLGSGFNAGFSITNGNPLLVIRHCYFQFYTDTLNPLTITVEAYNSFLESVAASTSTSSFVGTIYTSTIRRLTTESVAGLTLQNSFDLPY